MSMADAEATANQMRSEQQQQYSSFAGEEGISSRRASWTRMNNICTPFSVVLSVYEYWMEHCTRMYECIGPAVSLGINSNQFLGL